MYYEMLLEEVQLVEKSWELVQNREKRLFSESPTPYYAHGIGSTRIATRRKASQKTPVLCLFGENSGDVERLLSGEIGRG